MNGALFSWIGFWACVIILNMEMGKSDEKASGWYAGLHAVGAIAFLAITIISLYAEGS